MTEDEKYISPAKIFQIERHTDRNGEERLRAVDFSGRKTLQVQYTNTKGEETSFAAMGRIAAGTDEEGVKELREKIARYRPDYVSILSPAEVKAAVELALGVTGQINEALDGALYFVDDDDDPSNPVQEVVREAIEANLKVNSILHDIRKYMLVRYIYDL